MNVYIYVLETLADWEIAHITAELNSGRYVKKENIPVNIVKVGSSEKAVKTMGGLTIQPDIGVNRLRPEENDIVILPGADTWFKQSNSEIIDRVAGFDSSITVAAICAATAALAQRGILDTRKHTSNDMEFLKMFCPAYNGEKNYINQPAVVDGNLITASGLAPLDFSYQIFRKMDVMKPETLEAWYQFYTTREIHHFYKLFESIKAS